jgi:hypothetical protein
MARLTPVRRAMLLLLRPAGVVLLRLDWPVLLLLLVVMLLMLVGLMVMLRLAATASTAACCSDGWRRPTARRGRCRAGTSSCSPRLGGWCWRRRGCHTGCPGAAAAASCCSCW